MDLKLKTLIKNNLKDNFPQILDWKFKNPTYMIGGSIKDIMLNKVYKDLDFIQLSNSKYEIIDFINYNKFNTIKNSFGDDKIILNNLTIDFFKVNDLFDILEFDYDGLIYDIVNDKIIYCGYTNSINNRYATKINSNTPHPHINRINKINSQISEIIKYKEGI